MVAGALASVLPTCAYAQGDCSAYIGRALASNSFNEIVQRLPKSIAPKDEFETTAQFEARVAAAAKTSTGPFIMDRPVLKQTFPDPLAYDADAGMLRIRASAFDWGTTNWSLLLAFAGHRGMASVFDSENVATVIARPDRVTGSYRAANAFGVGGTVSKVTRNTDSIFVRAGSNGNKNMFGPNDEAVVGEIPMAAIEARSAKQRIRFALVIEPKWPFLVTGSTPLVAPTISDPRRVTDEYRIMIADVRCGLVLDQGKVLASYPAL